MHMRHGINLDDLPPSTDWHWLGRRILWLYGQRGNENTPASDTRKAVHNGRV